MPDDLDPPDVPPEQPPDPPGEDNVRPIRPGQPPPPQGGSTGAVESAEVLGVRALELRMAGASYQQIATALGYTNKGSAHRAVHAALRADADLHRDERDHYRRLHLHRLERQIRAWWTDSLDDLDAAKHVHTLMQREARLLGLDAPQQVILTTEGQQTADDALTRLREAVIGSDGIPDVTSGNG